MTSPSKNVFSKINKLWDYLFLNSVYKFDFFLVRFNNFYHVKVSALLQKIQTDGKIYKIKNWKDDKFFHTTQNTLFTYYRFPLFKRKRILFEKKKTKL